MKNYLQSHPLAKIGVFSLLLIPFVLLIQSYSPPKSKIPEGYSSTILAFEFVNNTNEVAEVLDPLSQDERNGLDIINRIDFGFLIFYSAFIFLFIKRGQTHFNFRWSYFLMGVPFFIALSDCIENLLLLKINGDYGFVTHSKLADSIPYLQIATWSKWSLLAIIFAIIGSNMARKERLAKVAGSLFLLPILLLISFIVIGGRSLSDLFASSIFLVFFVLSLFCFLYHPSGTFKAPVKQ